MKISNLPHAQCTVEIKLKDEITIKNPYPSSYYKNVTILPEISLVIEEKRKINRELITVNLRINEDISYFYCLRRTEDLSDTDKKDGIPLIERSRLYPIYKNDRDMYIPKLLVRNPDRLKIQLIVGSDSRVDTDPFMGTDPRVSTRVNIPHSCILKLHFSGYLHDMQIMPLLIIIFFLFLFTMFMK